ncbi:hypothetical protein J437_LFUL001729 [Ladona fulva]|uniref:Flavin-containing monooxygenase n=1 Tax=Ladona fulva TaxID=123851 RepID=A0A8K0NXJ3_LADFU|nr:hypothetical protein J437_LFUL001729 [Ladona fulva]
MPKEVMGYLDYPIPEQSKSYLPSQDILNFLESYADDFKVKEHTKFYHIVLLVEPKGKLWTVKVKDLKNNRVEEYEFDSVMVCNGHYSTPFIPKIQGQDSFQGKQIHSHDYRIPETFENQRVAVIGAGPSGMDIALEVSKLAKTVILSHHMTVEIKTQFPENVSQKPEVVSMTGKEVVFRDGSSEEVDYIFYCTGYKYSFPFLSEACGVTTEDNHVRPLYKHLIHTRFPTLCFVGLPFYVCAFSLCDLQSRFFLRILDGSLKLPSTEEMDADADEEIERRRKCGLGRRQAHMMGPLQGDYYDDLAKTAGIQGIPPVMTKLHNESSQRFLDDLVNYRNDVYRILDSENFVQVK